MKESAELQAIKALIVVCVDPNIKAWLLLNDPKALEQAQAAAKRLAPDTGDASWQDAIQAVANLDVQHEAVLARLAVHAEAMLRVQDYAYAADFVRGAYRRLEAPIPAHIEQLLNVREEPHCVVFTDHKGIVQDVSGPASFDACCQELIRRAKKESDAVGFDEETVKKTGNFLFPDQSSFSVCSISPFGK